MPTITYDGQSFLLDGRRLWLVGASVQYSQIPAAEWADRIHAAKVAGCNTIETAVMWSRHETRPGHFDFAGDNDLRRFVRLIGEAGLMCVLRIGPYVGGGFDLGGIPPWVAELPNVRLRANGGPFLDTCSRFIGALAEQVRDLQATNPGKPGPILLLQSEGAWTCGNDDLAAVYLGELHRYIREAGLNVPVIGAHNLWTGVEGEVDAWSGGANMLSVMRQLAEVRPEQPRLQLELHTGALDEEPPAGTWGGSDPQPTDGWEIQRRIAETLAAGAQFNIRPFHAGMNFGFSAGRLDGGVARFVAATADPGAPLTEHGVPAAGFPELRRITTFASRFGRVFANLNRALRPVVLDPGMASGRTEKGAGAASISVVPCGGSQGSVAFVFAPPGRSGDAGATLLLPEGTTLPVDLRGQAVVWCLMNVQLSARATLDFCNLSALASIGRVFVCFGHAGARGMLSINGTPIEVIVPDGRVPATLDVDGTLVVVCNLEQADSAYVTDAALYIGALGVSADGRPVIPASGAGAKSCIKISSDGVTGGVSGEAIKVAEVGHERPTLSPWTCASLEDYISGQSPRFASIAGPASLSSLGAGFGYGWYRITFRGSGAPTARVSCLRSGDRLHAFQESRLIGILGAGPGAQRDMTCAVRKGAAPLVVLADNLGRYSAGSLLGEPKGLVEHLWEYKSVRVGAPKIVTGAPVDVLAYRAPLWEIRVGDTTRHERITWSFGRRGRAGLVMLIEPDDGRVLPGRALLIVNNKPVSYIDASGPANISFDAEQLGRGAVTVQIAPIPSAAGGDASDDPALLLKHLAKHVRFVEGAEAHSLKADWAFAKWEPPAASAFGPATRARAAGPTWWKAQMKAGPAGGPIMIDLAGMTKGQVYVNGRHLARYFVATREGKNVGPQNGCWIPSSWLKAGNADIMLFDEHGGHPSRCRVERLASRPIAAEPAGA